MTENYGKHGTRQRIALVDLDNGFSGITRYVISLLEGVADTEFEPLLVCRPVAPYPPIPGVRVIYVGGDPPPAPGDRALEDHARRGPSVRVRDATKWLWRRLIPRSIRGLIGFLSDAHRLSKILKAESIDVLHVQVVGDTETALAGRLAGIPAILGTYHMNTRPDRGHRWLPEILTTWCLSQAIAVSESTRSEWIARCPRLADRMSVIPNGVAIRPEGERLDRGAARAALGLPPGAWPVIVSIGRLATQKGYRYLLEACALLLRDVPHLQLVLAGEGESRAELEVLSRTLRIDHCTHMLGHRSDVQPVLDAADHFVLPSLWEAMPFALLEAMASGVPVVATDVAGVADLVETDRTGVLVPAQDAAALADGLRHLMELPDRGRCLGESGQARIDARFSMASMLSTTFGLYRNLLSGKERSI